ncbi:MAG: YebC/PmpR family DNA-binding transcriptional regulator [Bacillota bacterium]
MAGHSKWSNIKHKKAKADEQRGKIFTKVGREIYVAAKEGGPDPEANARLKAAIQKAKEVNMPNDNIMRNIQKATGGGETENYEEAVYEGYGPGGVAILLNIMTDNRNRTASEIRYLFSRNGGNLGETGCVAWMFDNKGVINIELVQGLDQEELMLEAIEAGAEDITFDDEVAEIVTEPEDFEAVKQALSAAGFKIQTAEYTKLPQSSIDISDPEQAKQVLNLMNLLEDHDDVQDVYANFDIPDELIEQLG